jgi:hypothetical protein
MSSLSAVSLSVPGLWITGLERGLLLAGLAVALGGISGRGLARNFKGSMPAPLPEPWALQGCGLLTVITPPAKPIYGGASSATSHVRHPGHAGMISK